jgi:hypothetical protein
VPAVGDCGLGTGKIENVKDLGLLEIPVDGNVN